MEEVFLNKLDFAGNISLLQSAFSIPHFFPPNLKAMEFKGSGLDIIDGSGRKLKYVCT